MNRAQYTAAVVLVFIRDTAAERGLPKRKQIEIDAAVNSLGLDPSELSFEDKQESFRDLAELRIIHSDGERWFLAPELADWLRLPEDAIDEDADAGAAPGPGSDAGPAPDPETGDDAAVEDGDDSEPPEPGVPDE